MVDIISGVPPVQGRPGHSQQQRQPRPQNPPAGDKRKKGDDRNQSDGDGVIVTLSHTTGQRDKSERR